MTPRSAPAAGLVACLVVLAFTTGLVVYPFTTATATAHVKNSNDNWYFTGSTYSRRTASPERNNRADPINVIWRGPSGTNATIARAMGHTEDHWTDRRIPDGYPRGAHMRPRRNPFCTDPQHVFNRSGSGDNPNVGQWSQSRAYMSTNAICANQYHVRLFDSAVHGSIYGEGHYAEWVLTPIHHERARPGHHIDLPFDGARRVYMYAMGKVHCKEWGWEVHPETEHKPYGPPYSGIISRISFRHRDDGGCDGA